MSLYEISSRDYLARARQRLSEERRESLFYAAFELRCAVEARLQDYLDVWDHISNAKKKKRLVSALGRAAEEHFSKGDEIIRLAVLNVDTNETQQVFYYTPVSKRARKLGERLGAYLHAINHAQISSEKWWREFRAILLDLEREILIANTGTLLGPPLMQKKTNRIHMITEVLADRSPVPTSLTQGGKTKLDVQYLDKLPSNFEATAYYWKSGQPVRTIASDGM